MPVIEINGKKLEAEPGAMIIEVADCFNVQIPRFCYHKKLSIAANCRMCLVEVEKAPKPLPACATPVTEGMKVWTHSKKALLAQKSVMEFLLINHPLDCPICDQGGECELQDLSIGYGKDDSRYTEGKRVVKDKDLGPLISTDMTRCIQCTRCVRFGSEIAGIRELGATGRGESMEIGTYIEHQMTSEVSGNVIDLCPVGALTSKPFRFTARGWELNQKPSISPHDCVGSNIFVHTRRHQVMRVVPKENETINEVWISDKDRFSYEGLYSEDRLQHPKIKQAGQWQTVSWQEALAYIAHRLLAFKTDRGSEGLGALISPNATVEECYLFQKLIRGLGSCNIDHRLRQSDFRHPTEASGFPALGIPLAEIEQQSVVLLVGSHIHKEQPIVGLKLRKMTSNGGKALAINPIDFDFNFDVAAKTIVTQGDLVLGLARIVKAILLIMSENNGEKERKIDKKNLSELEAVHPSDPDFVMAKLFLQGEKKLILMGALALSHPDYSSLQALANVMVALTGTQVGVLNDGANHAGAWISGCNPYPEGLNAREMWEKKLKGYVLFNLEPDLDCLDGMKAVQALQQAELVISMTPFESKTLREVADVLLPLSPFTETAGTFINVEGRWQSFKEILTPLGESRPGWKILRVLGNVCEIEGFEYETTDRILAALHDEIALKSESKNKGSIPLTIKPFVKNGHIIRIAPIPLYATDGLVRRAKSLQKTTDAGNPVLHLNTALADQLTLVEGARVRVTSNGISITVPFVKDETIPDNTVMLAAGILETVSLGEPYSVVEVKGV